MPRGRTGGSTQRSGVLDAKRAADCQKRNSVIWTAMEGHVHARGAIIPRELTKLLIYGRVGEWKSPPQGLHPGDTLLFSLAPPQSTARSALSRPQTPNYHAEGSRQNRRSGVDAALAVQIR